MRSVARVCLCYIVFACCAVNAADTIHSAKEFFGGPDDKRRVIYIEIPDDEVLLFEQAPGAANDFISYGKPIEIRAVRVQVKGDVKIRAFPMGTHQAAKSGTGGKGDDGGEGAEGKGNSAQGGRGAPGERGKTGDPGTEGSPARSMKLFVAGVAFADDVSKLTLDNSGQGGGQGQQGGKGGTGGRGGKGQKRLCDPQTGPGPAGPRGAPGAQGTGGQGGTGGNGGQIIYSCALSDLVTKGRLVTISKGGPGGEPGDPGAVGLPGEPGKAGEGNTCGGGGSGEEKYTQALPADPYVLPEPSKNGIDGKITCEQ